MASSTIALRRATNASSLLSIRRAATATASRSFNSSSNAQVPTHKQDDNRSVDVDVDGRSTDRSVARPRDTALAPTTFFSDVFDPFSPTRSLSQVLNLMDRMMGIPLLSGKAALTGFDVKEDENAIYLRMDMPGVDKDKVTVCVEGNTLILKGEEGGEREEEEEEEENVRRYSGRIDLPPSLYKVDAIRAELKNGVLKIVVPKVEEEERKAHRYEVKVE